jgi:dienelactone hydrolase
VIGSTISHYRIVGHAGVGGMGVVYVAEDTRLNRKVALKFLPPAVALDPHTRARFLREAQAASALDHPNVATVYEVGDWNEQLFIVMAYYEGETLKQRIERGALSIVEAAAIARDIASGLAAAHRAGFVHRDLKPANVMLAGDGQVKILDFGLAKAFSGTDATATRMTGPGTTVGTVAYMAPEQAMGGDVDARADVWALGVTLFEMLTRRLPFTGESAAAMMLAVVTATAPRVRDTRPDVPQALASLVERSLEKDAAHRRLSAADIASEIAEWQLRSSPTAAAAVSASGATRVGWWRAVAAIAVVGAVLSGAWFIRQSARVRWAREQALPDVERLMEREQYADAFRLAVQARRVIATDPVWARLDPLLTRLASIQTTPAGATACYRNYASSNDSWTCVGDTPITNVSVPNAVLSWRVEKTGFETVHDVSPGGVINSGTTRAPGVVALQFTLHPVSDVQPGMVHATVGEAPFRIQIPGLDHLPRVRLHDFWIDRTEVTNRDFKRFVDGGGYRDAQYWQVPFVKDGRRISFEEAIASFTDSTGRPGPATWEAGSYAEGQDEFPVTGVSWFEASAYAAFAGKSLPTIYHWSRVAGQGLSGAIVPRSNFSGRGLTKVGATGGINQFGAVDLAGNVKEWCWNRADATRYYIMGGAWDEPVYMFNDPDARSPFERAATFGFRCVKYSSDETLTDADHALIAFQARDFRKETPISDERFETHLRLYEYDHADLQVRTESRDESDPEWRLERVSFQAAYGMERVPALMFLPKREHPPYQAVVYFPGSGAMTQRSSGQINPRVFDWILKSGRAVIVPIYKSTYERGDGLESDYPNRSIAWREHVIAWAKDVRRAVDYLESRADVDHERIAFMGSSWGAAMGPIYVAVEPRFKAAVFILGGFYRQYSSPEVDVFNFAPRVRVPVLLLNGRFDFFYPIDTAQLPMFELFQPPDGQKRRVVYETGHNIPRSDLVRESLDWLDRYLGKVTD